MTGKCVEIARMHSIVTITMAFAYLLLFAVVGAERGYVCKQHTIVVGRLPTE